MECLAANDVMELSLVVMDLMPKGKPNMAVIRHYPSISLLAKEIGNRNVIKYILLILKDFCASFNVARNMDENQMIKCATMMLNECDTFRLEDYVIMFEMAKKGDLNINNGKGIMDRIDEQMVSKIMDEYYSFRRSKEDEMWANNDKANAANRVEMVKALNGGESKIVEIDTKVLMAELLAAIDAKKRDIDAQTMSDVKQAEIKKEMMARRMQELYGFTDAQMAEFTSVKAKVFGSKINNHKEP